MQGELLLMDWMRILLLANSDSCGNYNVDRRRRFECSGVGSGPKSNHVQYLEPYRPLCPKASADG